MNVDEVKANLDMDKACADRIHKLCNELEQAIQEATNRGMLVELNLERVGIMGILQRPLKASVRRNLQL